MVTNGFGIWMNAGGGLLSTKPYILGSHYIREMRDFGQRMEHDLERVLATNPRVGSVV